MSVAAPGVVLTAALTGPIAKKEDHPTLPVTPAEIAAAAEDAWKAGAAVVHVHLRDDAGRPTADLEVGRRTLAAIRERCPVLIQLSTGVGLEVPFEDRERLVDLRPEMATLNVATMTFGAGQFINPPDGVRRLAERMLEIGIKPELEIYDFGHLELALSLQHDGLLTEPLQFSIVMGVRGGVPATPDLLLSLIRRLPESATWQVIAIGRAHAQMTALGLALGGNARTGLEDTLRLIDGSPAASNTVLVEQLASVARGLHREPVGSDEAATLLQLRTPERSPTL